MCANVGEWMKRGPRANAEEVCWRVAVEDALFLSPDFSSTRAGAAAIVWHVLFYFWVALLRNTLPTSSMLAGGGMRRLAQRPRLPHRAMRLHEAFCIVART